MNRKSLLKVLAVFLALGLLIGYVPTFASAQNVTPQAVTVESAVLELMEKTGEATYWVDFEYTVDLSPAYQMEWSERGWFVFNTLKEQAAKSQATAVSLLEASGVSYESFWIANRILVKDSNRTVLASLQQLPGVVAVRAPQTYAIYEPEVAPVEPMAVEANIDHVNAPDVWDLGYTGTGYTVANIDTGVRYSHQALVNQYRGNNGDGSFTHDYNWLNPNGYESAPRDGHGHGSHTMGTMVGDDGGTNQIGMAPGAQWIACAGCPDGSCPDYALLTCAQFVVAPTRTNGTDPNPDVRPDVVSNSWGGCSRTYDPWYRESVDAWQAAGVYPVFSNGNASNCGYPSPPGLNTVGNPARYGNVTGVGSSGKSNGQYANHSNWGPTDNLDDVNPTDPYANMKPQVLAPGVSIRSSMGSSDTAYGGMTGTSMSAPHVGGLLALMYQAGPCLRGDYAATELIIESTAVDMVYDDGSPLTPDNFPNFATGWGEIDALAAVQTAAGACGSSVLTGSVVSDSYEPIAGAKVQMTGGEAAHNRTVYTNSAGVYSANVVADTYSITASAFGFESQTVDDVVVGEDATVTQDFTLLELPNTLVKGTVTDAGIEGGDFHGYPLYAKVTFSMTGFSETVYTDPFTGEYQTTLYNGQEYNVKVEALLPNYQAFEGTLTPPDQPVYTYDVALNINVASCAAPGYAPEYDYYFDWEANDGGFYSGGENSSWAWGEITSGPGAAHSGTKGIATNPAGTYNNNERSWMSSQDIDLSYVPAGSVPVIEFWQWVFTESATYTWDQVTVQVSKNGGTTWDNVYGPTQRQDTAWNKVTIMLDPSYIVDNFRIRFYFKSDYSGIRDGWYIDDLGIATFTPPPMTIAYSEDFEADNGGYVTSVEAGGTGTNSWAWGAPTAHGTFPGGAHSGANVWATGLSSVYNPNERSLLTSPDIDLSAFAGTGLAPTLEFWHWMDSESNTWDWGEVRVSKDGGATYTTIYQKFGDKMVWTKESFALDPSYAVSNFKLQFFFRTDGSGQYAGWFIDDISIFVSEPYTVSVPCGSVDGGLVGGYVYDANFPTEKLIGARVETDSAAGVTALDAANPAQDGLYLFFQATTVDPEDVAFTVSKSKYETKVEPRSIEQDVVNHEDFEIGAGMVVADPTELTRTIPLHDDPETTTLTLINQGAGGANFSIREQDAGMQPYYIPPFTGEIEKSDVPASIFRDPNAAQTTGGPVLGLNGSRYGITQAPPAYGVDLFTDQLYKWPDASVPGVTELIGTPGPTNLFAGDFLGDDFSTLYIVSYANNKLYAVNTETADATEIGTTVPPTGTFSGLTGVGDTMYGVAVTCGTQSVLATIDLETAAVTTVGPITNATCLIDMSYVPETGMIYGVDLVSDSLIMIDPTTAESTVVGPTGIDANYAQGMDYDEENGIFYWASYSSGPELRIIDINTGASASVGAFSLGEVDSFAIAAGGGGDVPWLSEDPIEGYIPANSEFDVEVTFDVSGIEQPGWYYAFLKIDTDTPYPVADIPVTLHVVRPLNYGNIKGTVTATGKCDVDPQPLEKATVNFYKDGVLAFSTLTDEEGYYSYSLKNGTYDVEVLADGYVDFMETGVVLGWDEDVTVDVVLRLFAPCLTVVPESYYQELFPDGTATQTMTLLNTGAAEATYEISERPGDGPVPFADYEFIIDDGTLEDSIGLTSGGDFIWGNHFTVSEDILPFTLDTVQVMWNDSVAASDEVSVVVYHDPDRNPENGAVFVAQTWGTVQKNDGQTWVSYEMEDVLISEPGDILIMVVNRSGRSGYTDFPAGIDQTGTLHRRSWIGLYSGSVPEIPTLPADDTWMIIDDVSSSLAGNWMIRGFGTAGSSDIVWLEEDPLAGVVFPDGGTEDVTLTFDATDLVWGDYFGTLVIKNIPDPNLRVPVQLRVKALNMQFMPLILRNFPVPGQR